MAGAACVVACKYVCVKMEEAEADRSKRLPRVDENGCNKCNACMLFCPLYNPVELPIFEEFYEYDPSFAHRDMPKLYRETMRSVKAGQHTEFVGTLCEIAALKSLSGDKLRPNLIFKTAVLRRRKACAGSRMRGLSILSAGLACAVEQEYSNLTMQRGEKYDI